MVDKTVELASGQSVILDKLFGPMVFANLRITADPKRGWVIEREWHEEGVGYVEWIVIPAQVPQEFPKEE